MPIENDEGGGGGGSTTNICTVNPSDNVAILNNLLSRIDNIEKFLSQLVGADVHADNLSELAANIGNILNGTITLPSDGNSPYGTGGSIPIPDGFSGTVVSGNIITTWTDGVVSFQVLPGSGITAGIPDSGGGAVSDYIQILLNSKTYAATDAIIDWSSIVTQLGSAMSWSSGDSDSIIINEAGWYHVEASLYANLIGAAARTNQPHGIRFVLFDSSNSGLPNQNSGDYKNHSKNASTSYDTYWNCNMYRYFAAGDYIQLAATFFTTDTIRAQMSVTKFA